MKNRNRIADYKVTLYDGADEVDCGVFTLYSDAKGAALEGLGAAEEVVVRGRRLGLKTHRVLIFHAQADEVDAAYEVASPGHPR